MKYTIGSLYLCVKDMDRAIAFYENFLEQKVTCRDEIYSVFDIAGFRLGLFAYQKKKEPHTFGDNCLPSIAVENLTLLKQKLFGLTLCFPLTKIGANWVTEFIDSEGNHIELTAPADAFDGVNKEILIREADIHSADAQTLLCELNAKLTKITGDDGTVHFKSKDVATARSVFLIAYLHGEPYGCGALRELSDDTAEVKRVYARSNSVGIGSRILNALEENAQKMNYQNLLLETRVQNTTAISFYNRNGYEHCENYGVYIGETHSYCFRKTL
ncbi:MAG: GNAT family N-acetyltransferase [Butyrivibrio sp.]|nr:GNAT family N-acetyltransferase [Butyrivibrio sp.]